MTNGDWLAISLTVKLALVTTVILLIIAIPLAWWLSGERNFLKSTVNSFVSLPLVLPPTVLGFYLLIFMGPRGFLGKLLNQIGIAPFTFTFTGLVLGSVIYSLPFVVQPIQNAFSSLGKRPFEIAATLRYSPWNQFIHVALPMAKSSFWIAGILGFAHTVGEFGVVLMIGGNIPGETKVISVAIYDHVESMEYAKAHQLSAYLLVFSFVVLLLLNFYRRAVRISL